MGVKMKSIICLLSLFSLTFASDVLELTDADFASKTENEPLMLVEFFAPWCGHCKRLAPEYEKAATSLKDNDPPVSLAKVDCTANQDTCTKYGVSGYPTLKIFRSGKVAEDYDGPREAGGIISKMQSKAGPTSKELNSVEDTEKFLEKPHYSVVGFFKDPEDNLAKTFQSVADAMSTELKFAFTSNKDVLDKYKKEDTIVFYQPKKLRSKFEDSEKEYDGDGKLAGIKTWISNSLMGLCEHRTQDNAGKFSQPLVVAYFDVDYTKNVKGTNYWRNRVMKVGKKLRDAGKQVYFAISSSAEFSHELGEYGMSDTKGDKPVVAARDDRDKKYVMADEFSMDNLEKFVNDFLDEKLEPYLKSEAVPDSNDGPVKTVVAKNFDEIVNDPEKDVLIEFYAPWCGHCKQLEPKYTELGEKLEKETGITIAKMDATANDVGKPFEVSGFPTIFFVPKGSKNNPKKYAGGREVDDFLKYLAKEATDELSGYNRSGKKKKEKKSEL